jgi:glycerophosphoryl diester phosphodiesterase
LAVARENTLHSLNSAARNGADFVEFDVQLTKDKVPVVFHDFHVMVTVAKRQPTSATDSDTDDGGKKPALAEGVDFYQLAVKDLNLNQLRLLHLDHIHKKGHGESEPVPIQSAEVSTSNSHHRITGEHDEAEEHK